MDRPNRCQVCGRTTWKDGTARELNQCGGHIVDARRLKDIADGRNAPREGQVLEIPCGKWMCIVCYRKHDCGPKTLPNGFVKYDFITAPGSRVPRPELD